ncbi:MAG TPA: hypothetical protein VD905_18420 [Flavobacteriales bacterium]|nr:hypothetical protein [Flavobacteriales bacterium]
MKIIKTRLIYTHIKTPIQELEFDSVTIALPTFNSDFLLYAEGLEMLNQQREKVVFKGHIRFVVKNLAFEYNQEGVQVIRVECQPHRDSESLWFAYRDKINFT